MRARLRGFWAAQSARQRAVAAMVAVIFFALLYGWLLQSAARARVQLQATVATLREQAARLEQQALEYERLRSAPAATASPGDLAAAVRAQAAAAGLSRALLRIDAEDANRVQVAFGAVTFSDWLAMAASLQSLRIRLETCRIEAMSTPGFVSVAATFARAASQ